MKIQVTDLHTGDVLLETSSLNLGITFDGEERLTVSGNEKSVSTYLRDPGSRRPEITHSLSGFGELARMPI